MKLTKKILALVLSVLMVATMLPMSAIAATVNTAEDANAVALKNAITAYENKMDGSKYYTNMSTAYAAYVDANEAYDAYVYGDASVDLVSATNTLTNATKAMGTWSVPTITSKTGTWAANGGTYPSDAFVNLAYCGSADADNVALTVTTGGSDKQMDLWARYPDSTLIYDGVTVPSVTVMTVAQGDSGKNRYVYSIVLSDDNNNSLYLGGNWHGTKGSGNNWDYSWVSGQGEVVGNSATSSSFSLQVSQEKFLNNKSYPTGLTNVMKYNTDFANGVYFKEITPSFTIYAGSGSGFTNNDIYCTGTGNATIKVVNYKAIPTALSTYANKLNLKGGEYKQGGATDLISKFEAAMSFDVMSYFTSSNDYTGCANGIKTAVEGIANATKTADDANYKALRDAITATRSTYNTDAWESYTTETWTAFTGAYDAAKGVMASLPSTSYSNPTDAQAKADALLAARNNLQVNTTPADTFIVENTIDDALVAIANKAFFTTASYSEANLEALVPQAQAEIWTAVDKYKDKASAVDESEQAMVDAWVVTIGESIAKLEINTAVTVNAANGYSLVTALAEAQTKNKDDYSNYVDLATEITKAQKFETKVITDTTDTSSFRTGIVQAKIDEYETVVKNLVQAMFNLRLSFAKLEDGSIANSQTGTALVDSIGCNHNDGKYYKFNYEYPNNTVIFKTTHNAKTVQLPDANISFYMQANTQSKIGAGYLDSINLASSFIGETVEITSKTGGNDASLDDAAKVTYAAGLAVNASAGGSTYVYQLGQNNDIKNSGIYGISTSSGYSGFGVDASGNTITSASYDLTSLLAVTNGSSTSLTGVTGALATRDGSVNARATASLAIPATSVKTLTASTRPSLVSVPVANNNNLLALVRYSYPGAASSVYHGYTAKTVSYSQNLYVVDISYLIDLIKECDNLTFSNYTTTSWNNFVATLTATKDEMNYGEMTAEAILAECQSRYDALFAAKEALVEAATNDNLHAAIDAAVEIRNNGKNYTASTKGVFTANYNAAVNAINGTYSDDACLDLVKSEHQASIDAIANALTAAIANLDELANFDALQTAYSNVLTIANNTYTVASLQALADVISNSTYIYKTVEEKKEIGVSEQSLIDAEATAITNAINALQTSDIDSGAFDAAKVEIENKVTDPDAWGGVEDAKAYIDSQASKLYSPVSILGNDINGIALTQNEIDAIVTEAETLFKPMVYTVYVDGKEYGSYNYGEEVRVTLDQESDIFYAYKSNTTSNNKKYFATDKAISFVIKGDTFLTTEPVKNNKADTFKVTYVNALNNKVIAIDYVASGDNAVLPTAPSVAYYDFTGFTVEGEEFDGTNITSNVVVLANYAAKSTMPVITVHYTFAPDYADNETQHEYNEVVTLQQENAIYWIQFNSKEDFDVWCGGGIVSAPIDHVVYYGDTYTFRAHEDVYIASLTQDDYNIDVESGYIDVNQIDVPEVKAANGYVDAGDKISMIGTFKINVEKYEFVEAGMLVAKNHSTDLKDIKNATAENGIYRLKSSQHTAGNQFVISLATGNMPNNQALSYVPYMVYKDKGGNQQVVYGDVQLITYSK